MKRNLIFVSCLALLLSACSLLPSQSPEVTTVEALTWGMTLTPTHNQDGIPYCKPYLLKPLQTGDVINIDDVVEKCKYTTHDMYYSLIWGGWGGIDSIFLLSTGAVSHYGAEWQQPFCVNHQGNMRYALPLDTYWELLAFLDKHRINEWHYIDAVQTNKDELWDTNCNGDSKACKQLVTHPRGEKNGHFFLYGYRTNEDGFFFILDHQLYDQGIWIEDPHTQTTIQSKRSIFDIQKDRFIVKRWINGTLLEPFKSQRDSLDWDILEQKAKNNSIVIGNFQIETCEVPLGKTLFK